MSESERTNPNRSQTQVAPLNAALMMMIVMMKRSDEVKLSAAMKMMSVRDDASAPLGGSVGE